jgi:tetratricopeptide (TPR) repeat protein
MMAPQLAKKVLVHVLFCLCLCLCLFGSLVSFSDAFLGATSGSRRRYHHQSCSSLHSSPPTTATTTTTTTSGGGGMADLFDPNPTSWNAVIGEADRAFRRGNQLDKSGQPRAATGSFHEAATLFQCFLDLESCFGHVTSLDRGTVPFVLAYTLVRLAFLNNEALGDPKAAIRLYTMATEIDPEPSAVSFEGLGISWEATGGNGEDLEHLKEAVAAYEKALKRSPKASTSFAMAVALERLGEKEHAERLLDRLQRTEAPTSSLVDSWGYVRWHSRKIPNEDLNLQRGTRAMLQLALDAAMPLIEQQRENKAYGMVCEFGVGSGRSMRMTQEILPLDIQCHGFDTFTGLPQAWGDEPAGSYSTGGLVPVLEGDVNFHKGLFSETLPPFFKQVGHEDAFVAYANIDCDLYTSSMDIFENLHGRIVKGSILIFDEYICHATWRQDEFRAWRESCKRFGWKYEYLGFSLATKQAVVRVTDI